MINQSFLIEVTTGVFFAGCVVVENVSRNMDNMENTSYAKPTNSDTSSNVQLTNAISQ